MGFMDKAKQAAQNAQKEGGLLDKAKQAAQQAQEKLDETQKNFNKQQAESGAPPAGAPAVEYDKHGRPIQQDAPGRGAGRAGGHGRAAGAAGRRAAAGRCARARGTARRPGRARLRGAAARRKRPPSRPPAPPPAPPAAAPTAPEGEDDEYEPPKMTSGDPLAG